jgi:nitroreductase
MPELTDAILGRRTSKPATFSKDPPDPKIIRKCIEIARNAPNHHRTEPARFYLLDSERIQKIGQLFGEVVAGDCSDPALIERGKKKSKEWGKFPWAINRHLPDRPRL